MIDFEVKGAIFDVDDTLLDNMEHTGNGLHERSRLLAVREVGGQFGVETLANYSAESNALAFRRAKVHTLEGALWHILTDAGMVASETIDHENELLVAMAARKNSLHDVILQDEAEPIQDAPAFVRALVRAGVNVAIASTAIRRHIDIFLTKTSLGEYFPAVRVKSYESFTNPKPDPEVFNLAFDTLGLPESGRAHTCVFEDDPRGIGGAKAAGLYVCAITTRYDRDTLSALEVPPDLIADSYQEFAGYFGLELDNTQRY
ncbi:MAG TPA: HAD family phosphatase [Candidatus Limnocylindria bacterium]|nr:HAD family phosphatase [Candidatus Limnocylindria bacterium]